MLVILPRVKTEINLAHAIVCEDMASAFWPFHKPTTHMPCAMDPNFQEMQLLSPLSFRGKSGNLNYPENPVFKDRGFQHSKMGGFRNFREAGSHGGLAQKLWRQTWVCNLPVCSLTTNLSEPLFLPL